MYVGGSGLAGDRLLAFASGGAAVGKPLVSGAERTTMLRCRARFLSDGKHPSVEVTTPNQGTFRVDDPALIKALQRDLKRPQPMWLEQTEEPRMDCRPIALLSLQTVQRLTATSGYPLAADRFRVNILIDLGSAAGFREMGLPAGPCASAIRLFSRSRSGSLAAGSLRWTPAPALVILL